MLPAIRRIYFILIKIIREPPLSRKTTCLFTCLTSTFCPVWASITNALCKQGTYKNARPLLNLFSFWNNMVIMTYKMVIIIWWPVTRLAHICFMQSRAVRYITATQLYCFVTQRCYIFFKLDHYQYFMSIFVFLYN